MNLSDMANYVCTQVGLTDTDDLAAAQLFLRNWDEQLYNSYLWKDSLVGVDYDFDPGNSDNAESIAIVPPMIDFVAAMRVSAAPGVWGNSMRVHGMEDYYRVDWDWFTQQGVPYQFAGMSPVWFINRAAPGLQLVNNNIADSGAACEIIWYDDDNNIKYVQVITPGAQILETQAPGQPPCPVPASSLTVTPAQTVSQDIFQGNYNGVLPTFVPQTSAAIAFDRVTGQMFSWYNGQWH